MQRRYMQCKYGKIGSIEYKCIMYQYNISSVNSFNCGLTAEYPATRTNFFVAGYAVRRNVLIQVEVYNLF